MLAANQPGRSSGEVQNVFLKQARELGFRDESKGLFKEYTSALRPDYFLPLADTGIILEVERGKTTINNLDLLDFWGPYHVPYIEWRRYGCQDRSHGSTDVARGT